MLLESDITVKSVEPVTDCGTRCNVSGRAPVPALTPLNRVARIKLSLWQFVVIITVVSRLLTELAQKKTICRGSNRNETYLEFKKELDL
jgi:hypothetical protein